MKQTMRQIEEFLKLKRMAIIGVSRDSKHISRHLMRAFLERGYEITPVNPRAEEIEEIRAVHGLGAMNSVPEAALILLSGQAAEDAVRECIDLGIGAVWVYGIRGPRDIDPAIIDALEKTETLFVAGFCPFMFMEDAGFIHKLHGWIWKALGMMPVEDGAGV